MKDIIGQQLGSYQIIRPLARGGQASVYLGQHKELAIQAAIKVLHTHLAESDIKRFRQEAQTLFTLIHPNIVRVLDFGVQNGLAFLIMDYAPNGTLRQRHPSGMPLPAETIATYV